jgi:hypothetical protein
MNETDIVSDSLKIRDSVGKPGPGFPTLDELSRRSEEFWDPGCECECPPLQELIRTILTGSSNQGWLVVVDVKIWRRPSQMEIDDSLCPSREMGLPQFQRLGR